MSGHIEIESKIIEVNFKETCKSIEEIGGKQEFVRTQFTAIWAQNRNGEKIRIREEGDDVKVEIKEMLQGPSGVKIAKESTPIVYDNLENALEAYAKQGYHEISRSVKNRTAYILNLLSYAAFPVHLVIDEYSDLDGMEIPALLEIEVEAISNIPEIVEICKEVITHVAELLGYTEKDLKDWTARDLVEHYKKKRNNN